MKPEDITTLSELVENNKDLPHYKELRDELDSLEKSSLNPSILEDMGVDNWQGYCGVPDGDDYDTLYQRAIDRCYDGDY